MRRKFISAIAVCAMMAGMLAGCSGTEQETPAASSESAESTAAVSEAETEGQGDSGESDDSAGGNYREIDADSDRARFAHEKYDELFGDAEIPDNISESELYEIVNRAVLGEMYQDDNLTDQEREMIALATLTTNNTLTILEMHVTAALNTGMTPVEITETIYQCTPYVGAAKTLEAINVVNKVFEEKGIQLPVESQSTTTEESRWQAGIDVRTSIFGEMDPMVEPEGTKFGRDYLPSFCFGDFYTRTGLNVAQREMITLSCLVALGGAESQLAGHVRGNVSVGNDREYLVSVVTACIPYTGFPRMLNALSVINEVIPTE